MAIQQTLSGALVRSGTLPKAAGDAAFQAFLSDLLSKTNGGTIHGVLLFQTPDAVAAGNNAGVAILPTGVLSVAVPGKQFLVQEGGFTSVGAGVQNLIAMGAGLTIASGSGFNIAAGAFARFDNVVELTAAPALPAHLVNKQYVDTAIANGANGRNWVAAARAVATSNIALTAAPATVDGVVLASGDRVLLVGQADAAENGVYAYDAALHILNRTSDANSAAELTNLTIWVSEGVAHADTQYTCTADASLFLGGDPVNFVQTGGAGMMLAGWGANIDGNTVSIKHVPPVAPSGAVDGFNNVFVSGYRYAAFGETVEVDGVRVYLGDDYTLQFAAGLTTITFVNAPPAGARIRVSGFLA